MSIDENHGRPFGLNLTDVAFLGRAGMRKNVDEEKTFCSELVSRTLEDMNVLKKAKYVAHSYMPKHFDPQGDDYREECLEEGF